MYKKLLGQTALYGLTTVIIRLFPFIINPYITNAFGPEAYAPFADFYSVAGVIAVLLTHGMETTFFRFALDEKNDKKLISTAFFSVATATLMFLIFSLSFSKELAVAFKTPTQVDLLTILVIVLSLDAFSAMPFVMLRKNERPIKYASIKIANGRVAVSNSVSTGQLKIQLTNLLLLITLTGIKQLKIKTNPITIKLIGINASCIPQ